MSAQAKPEPPVVTAFLLCEFVALDPRTNRHHLIGIFDHVVASEYPTVLGGFAVYMNFTNMNGTYHLGLQLLRIINDEPGHELIGEMPAEQPLVIADPLQRVDFGVNFGAGTVIPAEGRYILRLLANDEEVQDFVLNAVMIEDPQ